MQAEQKTAKILRTSPEVIFELAKKMDKLTGKKNILKGIVSTNEEIIKSKITALGLNPKNVLAEELFRALIEKTQKEDQALFKIFKSPEFSTTEGCRTLINSAKELVGTVKGFFLKTEKAAELLYANPPKNILKFLGFGNIKKMLAKENLLDVFAALRFAEDPIWLNDVFFKPYQDLKKEDFEKRVIEVRVLPTHWLEVGEKFTPLESPAIYGGDGKYKSLIPFRKGGVKAPSFLTGFTGKKLHNISHLKELGVVFVIPYGSQFAGQVIELFTLVLHYLYEVNFYSRLFERYSQQNNFGQKLILALKGEVTSQPLPENKKVAWRIVQRYLAKDDPSDPRLFEPHVNPEVIHWRKAEGALTKLGKRFEQLDLEFFAEPGWAGDFFKTKDGQETLISFDLIDNVISLARGSTLGSKYLYHHQEALWNKIFREYIGEEELERLVMENLDRGVIII